jgi:hypothetical protein
LLEPLSTALGSTLGLSNVQLTSVVGQGFGASATKAFGRELTATFAESFGYPTRTSFALEAAHNNATAMRVTVYTQTGMPLFGTSQPPGIPPPGQTAQTTPLLIQPMSGTNGFDFRYLKKFPYARKIP